MSRPAWIAMAALSACTESRGPAPPDPSGQDPSALNLLLITLDTMRADHLSCYGAPAGSTPHLDLLASEGALFVSAYSQTNVTKPSHVSILTGLKAIDHGVFNNAVEIPEGLGPLSLRLQRKGLNTAAFLAASHLGQAGEWEGFDQWEGPPSGAGQRDGGSVTDSALRWLEAAHSPFFAWVHYYDAHTLYTPPEDIAARYYSGDPRAGTGPLLSEIPFIAAWNMRGMDRWIQGIRDPSYPLAMYAGEVHAVDREVGRLLASLRASRHWPQTVVIVVGDHGESLGENGIYYDHLGLHEPTLRIPLILRVPGRPAGLRIAGPVLQLDIAPTVCALFGIEGGRTWDGVSLLPALSEGGENALRERGTFVFEAVHNRQVAVRRGPWKLIWNLVDRPSKRLPEHSLLYDLDCDPRESESQFQQRPDVVAELLPFLDPWIELGAVPPGDLRHAGVLEELRELGYADD